MLGKLLNWIGAPGFVRPFEYKDFNTDEMVSLRTTPRYTILSVHGRELYFHRDSGRLDGNGAQSLVGETELDQCSPVGGQEADKRQASVLGQRRRRWSLPRRNAGAVRIS